MKKKTEKFDCSKCGACCCLVFVKITDAEIKRLIALLGHKNFFEFDSVRNINRIKLVPKDVYGKTGLRVCYFFIPETLSCMYYEQRPQRCREFEIGGKKCLHARKHFNII